MYLDVFLYDSLLIGEFTATFSAKTSAKVAGVIVVSISL